MKTQNNSIIRGEEVSQGKFESSVFETLQLAYRPYRFLLILFLILGFVGRALLLANANVIGWWVDSICQGPGCRPLPGFLSGYETSQFMWLLSWMAGLGFIFTWAFRIGFSDLSALAISSLYDETTYRTSRFPMSFFDQNPAGRIVTRFSSDYGNVFRLFGGPLAEFLSIVFDLFWMVVLTALAGLQFLPLILLMGFVQFLIYRGNKANLRKCRRELSASRSPSVAHFAETAQGASTIRSFNREDHFSERFEKLDTHYLDKKLKTTKAIVGFAMQMNFLTATLLLASCLLALYGVEKGFLSVGAVGVAFGFITLSGNTVQMFFEWLAQFEEAMVGVERMNQYLRSSIEPGSLLPTSAQFTTGHPQYSTPTALSPLAGLRSAKVEFKNVSFRYSDDLPWVLKNLNFTIEPGEKIGLVGRTGSGKSTIVQALFHLYPLSEGEICINDMAPALLLSAHHHEIDLSHFRQAISLISQDPTLFRGTLRENLDVRGKRSDQELEFALKKVGLDSWCSPNSVGLAKMIEEKGRNLSVGEKQLVCMARCLLQNSPLVILDEATSSVDPKSEEILVQATEEFFNDRTLLIIAHRLSTLQSCDRILWLQNGQVYRFDVPEKVLPEFRVSSLLPGL